MASDPKKSKQKDDSGFWKAAVGTGVLTAALAALLYGRRGGASAEAPKAAQAAQGAQAAPGAGRWLLDRRKFAALVCILLACILLTGVILGVRISKYYSDWDADLSVDLLVNPGVVLEDGSTVISEDAKIDLFSVRYSGADGKTVTVAGADGEEVIAPGTSGEFTFRLRNTGDVDLYYSIGLHTYISDRDVSLPLRLSLKGSDGSYLIGDLPDGWTDAMDLESVADQGDIDAFSNRTYTLRWEWPFAGDDALDTALGNMAVGDEVTFTVALHTLVTLPAATDQGGAQGLWNRLFPWLLALLMLLLIVGMAVLTHYHGKKSRSGHGQAR